jgi:PAS domain S-box-containing protein
LHLNHVKMHYAYCFRALQMMNTSQRWWISIPFLFALVVLIFAAWSVSLALNYPYDGIANFSPTGLIKEINPSSPAAAELQEGDVLLFIDGQPMVVTQPLYAGKKAGDRVIFLVQRGDYIFNAAIRLLDPPPDEIVTRLSPLFIALIFWLIGAGIQAFKPSRESTVIYFIFFQIMAILLIVGTTSYLGPPWTSSLGGFLAWIIGPLTAHFHFYFPQTTKIKPQRILLIILYGVGIIGGIPYILLGSQTAQAMSWFPRLLSANRIFLAICFLLVVGLLIYTYRNATTAGARGKIRIVVLGGALSLLPIVTLIILPDALLQQSIIPYSYLFIFLGVFPLTYGYAIFRHRLIEIERHVNRGATLILVYSILGGIYLILYFSLHTLIPSTFISEPVINTLLVLVLASVIVPLHRYVQRLVDSVFYGGWYDYRSAVTQITQGLEQITDLKTLGRTVSERLVRTLRLDDTCVFLSDLEGDYSIIEVAPQPITEGESRMAFSPLPRSSLDYLLRVGGVIERSTLRKALSEVKLSPEEHRLLSSEQVNLWVPIIGHGQVLGLLALGPKFGGDIFSSEDMDILWVIARQIAPLIENIHLVTRLKRYAAELERRVVERTLELHEAKERVEAILASVGEGVVVTDLRANFVAVNAAYEEQTGYEEPELVGDKAWHYYQGENIVETLRQIRTELNSVGVWSGDLIGKRKDGERFDVQLTITPLRDEQDHIVGYVGSQRDVTQQKELDRLKDLFVSDVSHELRTPTTNLSLYLELLEDATPERRREYLKVLREQSQLLMKLVEDILDLSRLTIGKARKVEFSPVDLNKLVNQIMTAHLPMAEASGLELRFDPEAALPPVWGEQNQLARLVNNLVSNALRYTYHGEVNIRTFERNGGVCLEVQDTGIGIEPEDRGHLFERFYRGRQVRQTKIHGTGLGLAIVKEIVDLHEGSIELDSEVGRGTTFSVYLPTHNDGVWLGKQS